jgi:hypothetical protein
VRTRTSAPSSKSRRSRAAKLFQAYHEGQEAFLSGVAERSCPNIDRQRHAAWRIGWSDMEVYARINSRSTPAPLSELWRSMERFWALISYADQKLVIQWLMEHLDLPRVQR